MRATSSPTLLTACAVAYTHPSVQEAASPRRFDFHLPNSSQRRTFFHRLIGHWGIFFGEVSIHTLCLFLNWVFVFSLLSWKRSFYNLNTRPLSDIWFAKSFSHFVGCFFTFLTSFEEAPKLVILMRSELSIFSFACLRCRCCS